MEERQIQKEAPEQVQSLKAWAESDPDAVLVLDADERVIAANRPARELFGWQSEVGAEDGLDQALGQPEKSRLEAVRRNTRGRSPRLMTDVVLSRGESRFMAEVGVGWFKIGDSEACRLSVRDVTARDEQTAVRRNVEKIRHFHIIAAGVAHEFNNLITGIVGHAELAVSQLATRSRAYADLQAVLTAGRRMHDLAHRMLANASRGLIYRAPVDLAQIASAAVEDVLRRTPPRVKVVLGGGEKRVVVDGEAEVLESMVVSLVTNGVEAIGSGSGVVTVSVGTADVDREYLADRSLEGAIAPGRYASLAVTDTGFGMDDILLERLFDPFFSTKGPGRGMGLSEVQGAVLAHGGAIVVNTGVGKGSTFTVFVPLHEAGAAAVSLSPASAPAVAERQHTVLVVDDEPGIRRYAKRVLLKLGLRVLTAEDGRAGVDEFRAHADEVDLVILDMFLPVLGGDEVLRQIRRIRPGVQVLLISGYAETFLTDKFGEEKPSGFLYKPFATDEFVGTIGKMLSVRVRDGESAAGP
jgi:PAS domain S-box-containing protein